MNLHFQTSQNHVLSRRSRLFMVFALTTLFLLSVTAVAFAGKSTLGDYVWYDANGDGVQDTGAGINNVQIIVYRDDGDNVFEPAQDVVVTTTLTISEPVPLVSSDGDNTGPGEAGYYDLPVNDGLYWVQVTAVNFTTGGPLQGLSYTGDPTHVQPDGSVVQSFNIVGVMDENDADFGFIRQYVDGHVYLDIDNDGSFNPANDVPLPGVDVVITDSLGVTYTVTTDASGYFSQTVPAGNTIVDVDDNDLPPGSTLTINNTDPTTVAVPIGGTARDDTGYVAPPGLDFVKLAGNAADGQPFVTPAGLVTYTYVLTNTGGTYINNIVITDDHGTSGDPADDVVINGTSCAALATPLAPLGTVTCTLQLTVMTNTINTAVVTGTPSDPGGNPLPGVTLPPVPPDNAEVTVTPPSYVDGHVYLDIDNDGSFNPAIDIPLPGVDVVITDSLGMTYTVTTDASGYFSQTVPPGNAIVDVDDNDLPPGSSLTGGNTDPTTVNVPPAGTGRDDTGYVAPPGLKLVKTAGTAADGQTYTTTAGLVTYTYLVTNTGGTYLDTIIITDDAGTAGDTSDDVVLDSSTCPALAGPLAPVASVTCTMQLMVTTNTINTAVASGTPTDPSGAPLPGVTPPVSPPDSAEVVIGVPPYVDGHVYLDIDNDGSFNPAVDIPLPSVDVVITDSLGVTYTVTTDASGYFSQTVPPGNTIVDVDDNDLPPNSTLTGGNSDPTTVVVPPAGSARDDTGYVAPPGLDFVKLAGNAADGQPFVSPAGLVTYTYVLTNTGGTYMSNIVITDDNGTASNTADDVVINGTSCTALATPLAPLRTVTCTLQLTVMTNTINTAVVTGTPSDPGGNPLPGGTMPPIPPDSAEVMVVNPVLEVTKVRNNSALAIYPGDPVSFTITVRNTGDVTVTVLPLTDTYNVAYLQFVSANPFPTSSPAGNLAWSNIAPAGGLPPGASVSVIVDFTALADTTALTNGEAPCLDQQATCNVAGVTGAVADPDGPGPLNPVPVPGGQGHAGVPIENPTAVDMAQMSITPTSNGIMIEWRSESEIQVAGYNLLRKADGRVQQLNSELIVARYAGQAQGASYSFLAPAMEGKSAEYIVEAVLLDGRTEQHSINGAGKIFLSTIFR